MQIICAYRLFLPFASITVSSRENAAFRNNIIKIAATKVSAGVCVGIGGHIKAEPQAKGDEQFEISDNRSFEEMYKAVKTAGMQPVTSDYIYL